MPLAPVQTEIKGENPIVFFDIRLGNKEAGRIEMEVGARSFVLPEAARACVVCVPVQMLAPFEPLTLTA